MKKTRGAAMVVCATAVVAMVGMVATVPALAAQKKLTIVTRGGGYHRAWWLVTLDAFKKAHPDIKVNEVFVGDGATTDKILAMLAAGIAPDIVQMDYVQPFAAAGMLEPLDAYMKSSKMVKSDFFEAVLKPLIYGGKLYAFDSNPRLLSATQGVNVDMFNNAGVPLPDGTWRWETEGLANGKKLTVDANGDGIPEQFFYDGSNLGSYMRLWWAYGNGGSFLNVKDGKPVFAMAEKKADDGMQFAIDLALKHKIAPGAGNSKALGGEHPWIAFYSKPNKVAMIEGVRGTGASYKSKVNFSLVPLLSFNNKRTTLSFTGTAWGMMKNSKNKPGAWAFLKWSQGTEAQRIVCKVGAPGVPAIVNKGVWDYFYELQEASDRAVLRSIETKGLTSTVYASPPDTANWLEVEPLYGKAIDKAISGKTTVREAMASIEAAVNKVLLRQRPLLVKR